tara:strand:+ start:217 stop:396 length:180 start_codon:yes stop_codon:yes gene_type:complete
MKTPDYKLSTGIFVDSQYADDIASIGIEYLTTDNPKLIEISVKDLDFIYDNFTQIYIGG